MKSILKLTLLLVWVVFNSCGTDTSPGSDQLAVSWKVISNEFADQPRVKAQFTIENKSHEVLKPESWALYYNQQPREILENPEHAVITRISGDWYKLQPTPGLILKPGEKADLVYEAEAWWIKEVDAPLGAYFVFYDKNGNEKQIEQATHFAIEPFVHPQQINRHQNDLVPIPNASVLFERNRDLTELPADQLPLIIPTPFSVRKGSKQVIFDAAPTVLYQKGLRNEAEQLAAFINRIAGTNLTPAESEKPAPNSIFLEIKPIRVNNVSREAYRVDIRPDKTILVSGNDPAGVFYGIQTIMALLPVELFYGRDAEPALPEVIIEDSPRFGFRSLHLDVARNFQTKETLKKFIDLMSFYKLNYLMLVLSEDEAWRIDIKTLPELTEVGSRRGHTVKNSTDMLHPAYGSGPFADNPGSYGSGFYTREDYREIIRYAHQRHVSVIPTINLPGHSRAAIRAMESRYERFMKEGNEEGANEYRLIDPDDKSVYRSAQYYNDNIVCVARESVYRFYEIVIDDIMEMHQEAGVPLEFFHTGGDEVPDGAWAGSPLCRGLMQSRPDITDPKNLQAYFFERAVEILQRKDLRIGGWEEVALLKTKQGQYMPNPDFAGGNIVPWVWNNMGQWADLAYRMANAGYPVVLCDVSNFYYDLAYNKDPQEPGHYWGGFADARSGWQFAPFHSFVTNLKTSMGRMINPETEFNNLERLKPSAEGNILGIQAQFWSETIKGPAMLEYYALPKFLGFVETAWTKARLWENQSNPVVRKKQMDEGWNVFANQLGRRELPRLAGVFGGFNYRIPQPGAIIENGVLMANVEYPGLMIRYTTDGTEPGPGSPQYREPIPVTGPVILKAFDKAGRSSRTISTGP